MHMNRINFVSAPCGSGKTHSTCLYIKENIGGTNFLYTAPSCHLLNQTATMLQSLGLKPRVITSETYARHVKGAIIDALKNDPTPGCILLVTWQAYVDLPFFPNRDEWQLIVDEIPQLDQFYALQVPYNQHFIADWVEIAKPINEMIGLVKPCDRSKLRAFFNKKHDDVHALFKPLLKDLLSPHKDVFVDLASWKRVIERKHKRVGKTDAENKLFFMSVLRPVFLDNAIMLGANFENSLLSDWFQRYHGVTFANFTEISGKLRTGYDTSKRRIIISYFLEERYFSKYKANKQLENGRTIIEAMDEEAISFLSGVPFLYVTNNGRASRALKSAKDGIGIEVYSHGLNCYDQYHDIYFSAALNREPTHLSMLKHLGFDLDYVHSATTHEVMYQAAMRTSLRRSDATEAVRIVLPDGFAANCLAALLGVREITRIGSITTHKQNPLSGTERNQRSKAKKIEET